MFVVSGLADAGDSIVHKEAADGPRAGVEVFVGTPDCGVDVPVMKCEFHISNGVGEVPDHEDVVGVGKGGDGGDVEELAGVELAAVNGGR